ncbi:hypothetical protein PRZ48_014709 [Zasmidium cellare]|uniref:Uncharacterized protein n=1 Tax=Zasmidium cellare TaxID=395010 RepID=A0ABR0DZP2_ZASCE|nr:hypothetical protein PRZ48_014709 [Zasmidium cellare]
MTGKEKDLRDMQHPLDYLQSERAKERERLARLLSFNDVPCYIEVLDANVFTEQQRKLQDAGVKAPDLPEEVEFDNPCHYPNLDEWRDTLRDLFNAEAWQCASLELVKLRLAGGSANDKDTITIYSPGEAKNYEEVLDIFRQDAIERATVLVKFKMGGRSNYEGLSGLPVGARKFLRLRRGEDGDVEPLLRLRSFWHNCGHKN